MRRLGAFAPCRRPARHHRRFRLAVQNFFTELGGILRAGQTGDRHGDKISVTQVSSTVGVGAAHGLGHHVDRLVGVRRPQVERLEHVQHFDQRHSARAGRRDRQDRESAEAALQRRADFRLVLLEIAERDQAAVLLHRRCDGLGDRAAIESVRAALGDQPQRVREFGLLEDFAGLVKLAVAQEDPAALVES